MIIHFFLADFGLSATSTFFSENTWKRALSSWRGKVFADSGELSFPLTAAGFGRPGFTGAAIVERTASGLFEAWLIEPLVPFDGLFVSSCCFAGNGTGATALEARGLSTTGDKLASGSADCFAGFGLLPKE
jgi:hypothetical protein